VHIYLLVDRIFKSIQVSKDHEFDIFEFTILFCDFRNNGGSQPTFC